MATAYEDLSRGDAVALLALTEPPVKTGANLTDADATIQPATDKASQYTLPAATLTTNRALTLGVTSALTGHIVRIVRKDVTANTYTVANGGTSGGNAFVFPASPGAAMAAWFYYNGADWIFNGVGYVQ